tara:strand:+ start:793 stop:1998 length:1206 start_codon:yes stop_codon:yes gene_type:complete
MSQTTMQDLRNYFQDKTVAVVGNAVALFDGNEGLSIDSHDIVCRFNLGLNQMGPPWSHGVRTDWLVYGEGKWAVNVGVFNTNAKCNFLEVNSTPSLRINYNGHNPINLPRHLKEELMLLYSNDGKGDKPTTGIIFLYFLTQCNPKNVSIFGFDFKRTNTYYNMTRKLEKDGRGHNWNKEARYVENYIEPRPNYHFYRTDNYINKEEKMAEVVLDAEHPHLGGNNVELNRHTFAPEAWTYIIDKYNIKSVMDVGSGYGHHSKWFVEQGLTSVAIEGLQKNVDNAVFPTTKVDLTENSYTTDVDMINCIEVVEHVSEEYIDNLLETLTCGTYIFMTHGVPGQRGHHHVNCQWQDYWINHLQARGFEWQEADSMHIRSLCTGTKKNIENGKHINESGLFFVRKV